MAFSSILECHLVFLDQTSTIFIKISALKFILSFLSANHLTDRVAKRFAESLRENRTLWHLDLSHNEIGEQGAVFLGAGLVGVKYTS